MLNRILEICEENRYVSLNRGFVVIQHGTEILGQVPLDDVSGVRKLLIHRFFADGMT